MISPKEVRLGKSKYVQKTSGGAYMAQNGDDSYTGLLYPTQAIPILHGQLLVKFQTSFLF